MSTLGSFILQFTWMLVYSIALAATGPLLINLPGDNMFVLMTWKLQITLIVFLPLAYIELRHKQVDNIRFQTKYVKKFFYILFASLMYLIWFMGLLEACRNSILLHALLMNNFGILVMRKHSGVLINIGTFIGISGFILLFYSSASGSCIMKTNSDVCSWKVDLFNALSSFAGCFYFRTIEKLETTIPKITLRTLVAFFSLILAMCYCFGELMLGYQNSFSLNRNTGILGWLFSVPPLIMCVLIVSTAGWIFGNFHHRHVTNILFMEPLVGQYLGTYIIKIDHFPPLMSILGGLSTLVGMYIVRESYERKHPTPQINQSYLLQMEESEKEVKELAQFMRQPSL